MDIVQAKKQYQCQKHLENEVEYFQIDNLTQNQSNQKLFYCSDCADQDSNFKSSNYQLIKNIIKSGKDQIFSKWPPVNDNKLLNQLMEVQKEESQQIEEDIERYFTDLKSDIFKQIDICQKNMIQQARQFPQNKVQILDRYLTISKVKELKSILLDHKTDINAKESSYRVFIENIQQQKQIITQQLAHLLDQHKKEQIIYNSQSALQIKQTILNSISSINFFYLPNIQNNNNNNNNNKNNNDDNDNNDDRMNKKQINLDVQFLGCDYNNSKKYSEISRNVKNEQQVTLMQITGYYSWINITSNLILKSDTKYIFRFEIQMKQNKLCTIGLMQDSTKNIKNGFDDNLCTVLEENKNKEISQLIHSKRGIDKLKKGSRFVLSKENVIEMRVYIKDQILQLLDYPNYHCQLELEDHLKCNLNNYNDLRLYIGLIDQDTKIIHKAAFIVYSFD